MADRSHEYWALHVSHEYLIWCLLGTSTFSYIYVGRCSIYLYLTVLTGYVTYRRRQWQPTPVPLPGNSHEWRSLVGYSPWGRRESDTTEWLHFHFHFHFHFHLLPIEKIRNNLQTFSRTIKWLQKDHSTQDHYTKVKNQLYFCMVPVNTRKWELVTQSHLQSLQRK